MAINSSLRSPRLRGESGFFPSGFTLIEVMLSLFIALLLLVATNAVFHTSAQTIAAGNALNNAVRNGRAVQPILFNDLNNCAADSPAFIISSSFVPQWLNAADLASNSGTAGTAPVAYGYELGDHLHRADSLSFFARGLFKRKTADSPYLVSTTTSNEAFVHYGHLRTLANDGVTYIGPDDYAGISEPYAADWVLGRNVILLLEPNAILPNVYDLNTTTPTKEVYYAAAAGAPAAFPSGSGLSVGTATLYPGNVSPLGYGSADSKGKSAIQSGRYDLAGTTIDEFRTAITNAAMAQSSETVGASNPYVFWWTPLVYQQGYSGLNTKVNAAYPFATGPFPFTPQITVNYLPRNRFNASSIPSPTPLTSTDQSGMAGFFQEHVSQFIVEYAGDYLSQNINGNITDTVPDGQIDWVYATKGDWFPGSNYYVGDFVIYSGHYFEAIQNIPGNLNNTSPSNAAPWESATPPKQIRWYGAPRDCTGSGHIYSAYHVVGPNGTTINITDPADGLAMANELNNVVPLADVWQCGMPSTTNTNLGRTVPYEVETYPTLIVGNNAVTDYAVPSNSISPATARYTAVWRNDTPAMVRILMKLDDPTDAVQDGPWFEYVFKLK